MSELATMMLPGTRTELSNSTAAIELQALCWAESLRMRGLHTEAKVMFDLANEAVKLRAMVNDIVEATTKET